MRCPTNDMRRQRFGLPTGYGSPSLGTARRVRSSRHREVPLARNEIASTNTASCGVRNGSKDPETRPRREDARGHESTEADASE